jgi:hypothetical protein
VTVASFDSLVLTKFASICTRKRGLLFFFLDCDVKVMLVS